MNKVVLSTIIAAICAAPAISSADTNLYGQMRYSFNSVNDSGPDGDKFATGGQNGFSGNDNVSLFGLKGSVEGDDGIKAFYHLQTGAPTDAAAAAFAQRFYFAGLSGDFGKVAYGRMTNAYKFAGFKMDPFYNLSHVNASGNFATGGATYGLSGATNGFTDNALQYTSMSFNNVKVNAGVYLDDSNENAYGTNIGASWSDKGINAGVQIASNDSNVTIPGIAANGDAIRLHGGYKTKKWSAGISFETVDTGPTTDTSYMYLVGRYNLNSDTELIGSFGTVDSGTAEGTGIMLGAFKTVAPKTQVYVTFGTASLDHATKVDDPSVLSLGAIHKFGFGG